MCVHSDGGAAEMLYASATLPKLYGVRHAGHGSLSRLGQLDRVRHGPPTDGYGFKPCGEDRARGSRGRCKLCNCRKM